MKEWREEHCAERPPELQAVGPELLIQRKNIQKVEHKATGPDESDYTEYVCESREITVSEYEMIKSIEEINAEKAVDAYTMQLIEEGVL